MYFLASICMLAVNLFYINEPVVNMRENPTSESKVVSQAFFSEEITVQEISEEWTYITTSDQYSGWISTSSFVTREKPYECSLQTSRLFAHIYGVKDTEFGPIKTLPYGSKLCALDATDSRWVKIALPSGKDGYIQKGDVLPEPLLQSKGDLVPFSKKFLGLPYTWGGRTSFGWDCSGFVQTLYRAMGIMLQRDSKQQVLDDRLHTIPLYDLEPGDLIFFGKSKQKICHVGMYLGNGQFIHSTVRENQPWVRISNLSDFEWSGHKEAYYPYRIAKQLL